MIGGPSVDVIRREIEAETEAAAGRAAGNSESDGDDQDDEPDVWALRESKASEVAAMLAVPFQLALRALELHNGDVNVTTNC